MDCAEYRRRLLADPEDSSAELTAHRESCAECRRFTERLMAFESRLERALRIDVAVEAAVPGAESWSAAGAAAGTVVPIRPRARPSSPPFLTRRRPWLAIAASAVLALVVGGALWLSVPKSSLAGDVVTHMAGEPQAWKRTDIPVSDPTLNEVLRQSHVRLTSAAGMVSYASSCSFRGHQVPHLVIQTEYGPITVMVLVHEHVAQSTQFDEQGYRGVIVPVAGHGSLAVLGRGPTADFAAVERIAARVQGSIDWTG